MEDLNFDASDDDADVAWQLVALPMFVLVDVEASDFAAEAFEVGLQLEVVVVENETEVELLAWLLPFEVDVVVLLEVGPLLADTDAVVVVVTQRQH